MKPWVACLAALLLAGCGPAAPRGAQPPYDGGLEPGPSVADCRRSTTFGDRGTVEGPLAEADSWLHLAAVTPELRTLASTDFDRDRPVLVPMLVWEWGDLAGSPRERQLEVAAAAAPWMVRAMDRGDAVYLATNDEFALEPGDPWRVYYALGEAATGELYFLMDCGAVAFRVPLQRRLGAVYQARLRSILGVTDREAIIAALGGDPAPGSVPSPVVGDNVATVGLTAFDLVMIPTDPLSPEDAVCGQLPRGSLGCAPVSTLADENRWRLSLPVYASPTEPAFLDLRLASGLDGHGPYGVVPIDWVALQAAERRGGAVVVVRLNGDPGRSTGSLESAGIFAIDDLEADDRLRNQVYGIRVPS